MRIKKFRVRKYRNIQDSGYIDLLDDLTCIVGKNQSGKTSLLKALHKFNPHDDKQSYNMTRDWPRGDRRTRDPKQIVCEVTFSLDDAEKNELAKLTSEQMTASEVIVTKNYDGHLEVHFPEKPQLFPNRLHPNAVDALCEKAHQINDPVGEVFSGAAGQCAQEVQKFAREGRFTELLTLEAPHTEKLRTSLTQGNPNPQHTNENAFLSAHSNRLKQVSTELQKIPTMQRQAHDFIVSAIPTFIYMDEYLEFRGFMYLKQLKERKDSKRLSAEDETFLMLLSLSGLDLERLIKQGDSKNDSEIHERQLDLQDGATTLTKEVAGRWGQQPYNIEFRVDDQIFLTNIQETNKDVGMLPLEEQSKGFKWFFSFDLHFMHESNATFEGCVLLLDEPGLHLHPGGQSDLLKRLDAYAEKNMLIYTTHLPFLVDLREPGRIHVIRETEAGAVVTDDLSASGVDEKMTLQAALGMKLNQHFMVSERNLVVEGADDFYIISELSSLLEKAGKKGLPSDVEVTAAGGADEVVYLTTFMVGQGLKAVALFDSDPKGKAAAEKLTKKWIIKYKNAKSSTLLFGSALGLKNDVNFAIEDIFPEAYYLQKVEESHKEKIEKAAIKHLKLEGKGLLCDRVAEACEKVGIQFNKGSVAKAIKKDLGRMSDLSKLDKITVDHAEKLFSAIDKEFGK